MRGLLAPSNTTDNLRPTNRLADWTIQQGHATDCAMSSEMISFEPGPDNAQELRRAFGQFGTGVTIVTVASDIGPLGMTANSFSSISLDPPLVLWAPAIRSKRHDAFVEAAEFCVHILDGNQLEMAKHFASNGHDFEGFPHELTERGVPLLNGVRARFLCSTHAVHPGGDHSIVIGAVARAEFAASQGQGLLFDQGRFGVFTPLA